MSRLPLTENQATPEAAQVLFDKIRKGLGKVPNAYQLIGSHSPESLSLLLAGDAALSKGSLSRQDIEAIRLAISAQNGCDYCVAAHVAAGKAAGLSLDELRRLVHLEDTAHTSRDALVRFVRETSSTSGTVPEPVVSAVRAAGYSPSQVIEALMVVALITFTNLVNRVNDTVVDFPKLLSASE